MVGGRWFLCSIVHACRSTLLALGQNVAVDFLTSRSSSGSRDVAASHSQTAVAAAETLRRHTLRLLLRQQRRCGVTLLDCCCGSRDGENFKVSTSTEVPGNAHVCQGWSTSHQLLSEPVVPHTAMGQRRSMCATTASVVPAPAWCAASASTTGSSRRVQHEFSRRYAP